MWDRYTVEQLLALIAKAKRAAECHFEGGRPYMESLCRERAAELEAALAAR